MTVAPPDGEDLQRLAERIDLAAIDSLRSIDVHTRLAVTPEESSTAVGAIAAAFLYVEQFGRRTRGERQEFIPISQFGEISNPPPIDKMPEWALSTWERCAGLVNEPVARARLHDLCFEAGLGNGRDHAAAAAEAYMEIAAAYALPTSGDMEGLRVSIAATHSLRRALDLARRTGQRDLARRIVGRLVVNADLALTNDLAKPGVVLGFIEPLCQEDPAELDDLLARARARYRGDLWNTRSTIELELARPGLAPAARQALRRQDIDALLEAAGGEKSPIIAMTHLQEAAQAAQQWGFRDLRESAITQLQSFAGTDVGLVTIQVSVPIDREIVDEGIRRLVEAPSWSDALMRLLADGPPSGRIERNRSTAELVSREAPFASRLAVNHLGGDGLPRVTSSTDEERSANQLARVEINTMQIIGSIHAEALRQIGERWAPIDEDELAQFFAQLPHVPGGTARALARSFGRFFAGDPEGACFTAIPRIERLVRELLLGAGAPVFRPEFGGVPGQYPGLGALLQMMIDRGLDESWQRFIGTLLVRQEGANLRNEALHGSVDEVTFATAAMVLVAALYLAVAVDVSADDGGLGG